MNIVQGNLVMVGLNTSTPQVFFNGTEVKGIVEIKVEWEQDEQRLKLRINGTEDSLYMQLVEAGITVKKVMR